MLGISRCLRWIRHLSRTTFNRFLVHLSGFCGIISDFSRRGNRRNMDGEISLARVALAKPWRSRRRHGAAATTHRMLLIQFQEHSGRAVSCPFAPYTGEIEGARIHTYIHTHRACVQGFINWITPDETSVRDASGCPRGERLFRATLLAPFRPANRSFVSLHPPSRFPPPPPPPSPRSFTSSSSRDLASFAETGYRNWRTRESRSPLSVPRAQTRPISASNSSHVSDPGDKTLRPRDKARSAPAR